MSLRVSRDPWKWGSVECRSRRFGRPRRSASRRLTIEALEDRTLLSGVDVVPADPRDWPMFNHDPQGTRSNAAETTLGTDTVGDLEVLWSLDTQSAISGTPAVVRDVVYAADAGGIVYAVDRNGNELWQTQLDVLPIPWGGKVTASVLVTNRTVVVGDLSGQIHGLDADTGDVRWTTRPNPHPFATIFGSATMVGNYVAVGVSSLEEVAVLFPGYTCCTFRGSLALLDPADGNLIWQTYMVDEPTAQPDGSFGPSGAAIWSTPTFDRATNTIYVTTGNNYSQPTTNTSDAIIAVDAEDGSIKWVNQRYADDEWNFRFLPEDPDHPDFDFGDSPQIYKVGGRTVVGAGQKSGFYHALDALTGETINQYQAMPGGQLGGLFADSAVADGVVYANGNNWPFVFTGGPPLGGSITALAGDGSGELWQFETESPNISGVAVANGVVYFQSTLSGDLYALDASTGAQLVQVNISTCDGSIPTCGQTSGPSISRGRVYVGVGDVLSSLFNPFLVPGAGALVALGLADAHGAAIGQLTGDAAIAGILAGQVSRANTTLQTDIAELGDPAEPNQPEPPLAGAEGVDAFPATRGAAAAYLTATDVSDELFASADDGTHDPAAIEGLLLDELAISLTALGRER